ncbi:SGNH hydrolase domain-containing protein, partial [Candidatus Pelagibacter ubique]|nr:SGNH hydrolase domain-containing protein [Candidatus Pelagibacter ubique]
IKHKNFYKLYPHNYFCNLKNHNKCRVFFKTKLLYLDDIHYSNYIAKQVSDEILNIVKNFKD